MKRALRSPAQSHRALVLTYTWVSGFVLLGGCSADAGPFKLAEPAGEEFARDVYPVLLRDCGMSECHGAEARFFRVFGPGRTRLSASTDVLARATPQEILVSYNRSRALLEPAPHTRDSLLLRKPLAQQAGGTSHEGSDAYGRNVYADRSAEGYRVIAAWAAGGRAEEP